MLTVPDSAMPSAYVQGTVLDAQGKPLPTAGIHLVSSLANSHSAPFRLDAASASFRIGPLPAGRYFLWIEGKGHPRQSLPSIELKAAQNLDLGMISFAPAGSLAAKIEDTQGKAVSKARFRITDLEGLYIATGEVVNGRIPELSLAPGAYALSLYAKGLPPIHRVAVIRSGLTTHMKIRPRKTVQRELRFELEALTVVESISILVHARSGKPLARYTTHPTNGFKCKLRLPPGEYRIEARTDDWQKVTRNILMGGTEAGPMIIKLR